MMSPDGKWVWDGQKWIPVAVHESVFPAYSTATAAAAPAETASPFAETMVSPPVNPFAGPGAPSPFATPPQGTPFAGPPAVASFPPAAAPAPAVVSPPIVQPPSYTAAGATPPWQAWASSGRDRSQTMKLVAAFIAVALGVVLAIYFGLSQLPFLRAGDQAGATPTPTASPIPELTQRSDSAVASRYVEGTFASSTAVLTQPLVLYQEACNGTLSFSCQQALTALSAAVPTALAGLDPPPPTCIARQVAKVKYDVTGFQNATKGALKAYNDNNRSELVAPLAAINAFSKVFQPDIQAVKKAQALCDTQPAGP